MRETANPSRSHGGTRIGVVNKMHYSDQGPKARRVREYMTKLLILHFTRAQADAPIYLKVLSSYAYECVTVITDHELNLSPIECTM
jgi:hypothetical protein